MSARTFRSIGVLVGLVVVGVVVYVIVAAIQAGNSAGTGNLTNEAQLRKALDTMPYPYTLGRTRYAGVDQAYVGRVTASWSSIDFSVSICDQGSSSCPPPDLPHPHGLDSGIGYGRVSVRTNPSSGGIPGHKSGIGLTVALDDAICHATGQDEYGCE